MSIKTIGRYQIKAEIGRGGMATVYHAFDPQFERDVAVKVLPREFLHDPEFRHRFQREARTIARLEHPAIVPVHDFGDADGQLYLVMRLMSGGSLSSRMQEGPMPVSEIARIFKRLGQGLDSAHAQGIIHRDLKPDNILFDRWDEPYLADFGIVKLVQGSKTALTATGGIVGTPAYMSPEQVRANEALDGRSDLYALGVILFEMLTGQQPYRANTPIGQAIMHINEPVPRVLESNPSLPPGSQRLIDRAMAKDKTARPDSARMLAEEVAALVVDGKPDALPDQAFEPPGDPPSLQTVVATDLEDEPPLEWAAEESQSMPDAGDPSNAGGEEVWPDTSVLVHPELSPEAGPSPAHASETPSPRIGDLYPPPKVTPSRPPVEKTSSPHLSPRPKRTAPVTSTGRRWTLPRNGLWAAGIFAVLAIAILLIFDPLQLTSGTASGNDDSTETTLAGFMSTRWSEEFEATDLAYGAGSWAVVMTQGVGQAQQSWRLAGDFPTEFIQEKWTEGFEVTALAYGRGQWAIMLTRGEVDRRQTFNLDSDFPSEYIEQKWEEGFELTSLAYGSGQWALIMSQGRDDRRQSWRLDDDFPEDYILERWQAGFDLSSLAYGSGQWAVILTESSEDRRQTWRLTADFPQEFILEQWPKGYHISAIGYGSGQWAVVMTQSEGLRQTWRLSPDFD